MLKLNKNVTDTLVNKAIELVNNELSDLKSIEVVYNISKRVYEITMIYDYELMQNNLSVNIPLGLFTITEEKTALYDAADLLMNAHFNAMTRNDLLSL